MPGKVVSSNVKPLGELNPDFVISVKYLVDPEGVPLENSDQKFAKLINALSNVGFHSQVRPGEDSTLLVFIKLSDAVLLKTLKSFHLKDYLYGVKNSIDDDEQILDHLSSAEKLRAAYSLISDPKWEGGASITPGAGEWQFVEKIIPLYDQELSKRLVTEWGKKPLIDENDIAIIKDLAGEKVALYFGFLRFYTVWLVVPSVLGFISYVFFSRYSIVFTILNLLWSIIFVNAWKKKENIYAITWNSKDSSLIESKRGEFVGETEEVDTVTGIRSPAFPTWKRTLRELAFLPVAIGAALTLISYQFGCFFIEIFLNEIYDGPGKQFLSLVPTILIVAFIPILTAGYTIIVNKYLAWENHETNTGYERSFVQKQFILNFLASYMPLLITSFVYLPFGHLVNPYLSFIQSHTSRYNITIQEKKFQINKDRLNQQFAYFAVTAQVIGFFVENIVPVVLRKVNEYFRGKKVNNSAVALTDLPEEAAFLQDVRKQVALPPFNVNDEYREMVIQFGYLALFSPVWSLAPIVSLINNWVEFRGDAYKLLQETHRPIPVKVDSIAPWGGNLRGLTWFATLVAPAITALFRTSDILEADAGSYLKSPVKISAWGLLALILVTEHISIALNFLVESVYHKIGTKTERDFHSNVYETRRQYIDAYLSQTEGGVSKRSITIDPTEQHWENFSDEQVVKHATIIPRQVLDAVALKKQQEEAEKEEAAALAEQKKEQAAQEKALADQERTAQKNATPAHVSSGYQAQPEDGSANLQSRSAKAPVDSTYASKSVPQTSEPAGNGHGVGPAAATAAAVGAGAALAAGNGSHGAQQQQQQSRDTSKFPPASRTAPQSAAPQQGVPQYSGAPQTSQGYTAAYGAAGTSKIPSDAQQKSVQGNAASSTPNAKSTHSSPGPAAAGAGTGGVAGAAVAGSGSRSTGPSGEYASSENSTPSKSSGEKKGGFLSKLTKKDSTSKSAKNDVAKTGPASGTSGATGDVTSPPNNLQGTGHGSTAAGVGAVGAGVAGAGIASHESSNSKAANPSSTSGVQGQSNPSSTQGQSYKSTEPVDQSEYQSKSRSADPQSDSVNPYNAVPKDSTTESSGQGKGTAAGLGAGAGAIGAGAAASSGSGSNDATTGVSPQKEEKKGGFFSKFTKKDATNIAKAGKTDASKLSSRAQDVAGDVKKGDYSSAKQLAGDIKESPHQYFGNTKQAINETKAGTSGAEGQSGAATQDYTKGASQVGNETSSSGHGISGKDAAVGAGVGGAAGAGYASHESGKKSAATTDKSSAPQGTSSSSGATSGGAATGGAAGATLPPNLSSGSSGQQSKSTAPTSKQSQGSTTGYTGSKAEPFANQPSEALNKSDAKGYSSAADAEKGSSGKSATKSSGKDSSSGSHGGAGAAAATGAGVGAAAGAAGASAAGHSKSSTATDPTNPNAHLRNPFLEGAKNEAPKPTEDVKPQTLDPNADSSKKSTSGGDGASQDVSGSKPSKTGATEDSHPTSTGGIDNQNENSGGYSIGGIAAGIAGAAGATGLASKFPGSGSGSQTQSKEGTIPSGDQKVSSNLSSAGESSYVDSAKGYAQTYGGQLNEYVQVAADKVDDYAKNSDNQYVSKGNQYVQQLADKSDEYAHQQASGSAEKTKSAQDPSGSAGAAATKSSSGGESSNPGAVGGIAGAAGSSGPGSSGPDSSKPSSAAGQFANKKHSGTNDDEAGDSLPQHFQQEVKNPFTGQAGPVPGTEDQVISGTDDVPQNQQGAGAVKSSSQHGDTLAPPKAAGVGGDSDSASSTSSPRKKKGLFSTIKQKVKGNSSGGDSAASSAQNTPKKTSSA